MKDGLQKLLNLCPTNFGYRGRKIEISVLCDSIIDKSMPYQSDFITVWCYLPDIKCDYWKEYISSLAQYVVHNYGDYIQSYHDLKDIIESYTPVKAYRKVYGLLRYDENIVREVNIKDDVKAEFVRAVKHYLNTYRKIIKVMIR